MTYFPFVAPPPPPLALKARTPSNSGFTVTRDGTGDNTAALNGFFALLASSGDPGALEAGTYRTAAELLLPAGAMSLQGAGSRRCVIAPASNTYHGLRCATSGNQQAADMGRHVGGFAVQGPDGALPVNGKAAFVLDASPQATVSDIEARNYDIGFDLINNCFNTTFYGLRTDRTGQRPVNCAINIREGAQSGSDLNFYDAQVSGKAVAVCMAGNGGGYRFLGFSIGTVGSTPNPDTHGVFTIGYDYASDAALAGVGSVILLGGHVEGWRNRYMIRSYGANTATVQCCGIVPSASAAGEQALGLLRATAAANSTFNFIGNDVGGGGSYFANAAVMSLEGDNDDFNLNEVGWASNPMSVGGTAKGRGWLRTLGEYSNYAGQANQKGVTWYAGPGGAATLAMQRTRLRANQADGTWFQSSDNGATSEPFGRPFVVRTGNANQNVETWFSPGQIRMIAGTANTVTVRADADANCLVNTKVQIVQSGSGQTTVAAAAGVTIQTALTAKLRAQGSVAFLEKISPNYWILYGDLAAA